MSVNLATCLSYFLSTPTATSSLNSKSCPANKIAVGGSDVGCLVPSEIDKHSFAPCTRQNCRHLHHNIAFHKAPASLRASPRTLRLKYWRRPVWPRRRGQLHWTIKYFCTPRREAILNAAYCKVLGCIIFTYQAPSS